MADRLQNVQTEDDIRSLEGLEAVRVMPGMYVGGSDERALHHLVYEVVDNSIDEIMAGRGDHCWVTIHTNGYISVEDNCGGIPVGLSKKQGISTLTMVLTQLHAGAKFNDGSNKAAYKVSGGLHGVGVSAVNALSSHLIAEVKREGKLWRQEFAAGKPTTTVDFIRDLEPGETNGTTITFHPDMTIMQAGDFKFAVLAQRFREMAYVTRGATLTLIDEREQPFPGELTFYFEGGVLSFTRYLNRNRETVHPVIGGLKDVKFNEGQNDEGWMAVEFGFQYTEGTSSSTELSFANHINTPDGGSHQTGLREALTRAINNYSRKQGLLKEKDTNFSGRDTLEGLTAIVSIKHPSPQFESQTKGKLINPEIRGLVASVVTDFFMQFMEENPREARRIIDKCMNSMRIRDALEKQRELLTGRKSLLENTTLPGKLADCSERDATKTELFLVEGDSAGGCCHSNTQVILASGVTRTMRELAEDWDKGITHFGFATNEDGDTRVVPLVEPRITKRNARLVEVTLDNGEKIQCTPDHPFRLRDGSYKAAEALQPNESLMPIKRRISGKDDKLNGYEMIWQNHAAVWIYTHILSDMYNLYAEQYITSDGNVRHHIDFNKRNNDPRNLRRMDRDDHWRLHSSLSKELAKRQWSNPEFREYMSRTAIEQWRDAAYKQYMSNRAKLQRQDQAMNEKVLAGFKSWFSSLTAEEYDDYCERMRQYQSEYWSNPENRAKQSEKTRQYFIEHPEARDQRRTDAIKEWEDSELRAWRAEMTRAQWTDEYRQNHSNAVKHWMSEHPEHREKMAQGLKAVWQDERGDRIRQGHVEWLKNTSPEEKGAKIREGHRVKALLLLREVLGNDNLAEAYETYRLQTAKTAPSFSRLLNHYFNGDHQQMLEAAQNVNCKVASVVHLEETSDVYDLTVDVYHNFALASGVFVHNSAKQGRDRHFQAILPLRGKILNTERARLNKILDSNEIKSLISALGVGISDDFEVKKLRYHKLVIMSVAGDEPTLVQHKATGRTEFVRIGDFIDSCVAGQRDAAEYQVMSFDLKTHETRFRPLKAVIRHPHHEAMYKLVTRYNRSVKVTSSHSVFVLDDGEVKLKKGNEIKAGDTLVASRRLPRTSQTITEIDVLQTLVDAAETEALYVRGEDVRQVAAQRTLAKTSRPDLLDEPRVLLPIETWAQLTQHRQTNGMTQMAVAQTIGVRQPITISHWERQINRPILSQFNNYLGAIGWSQPLKYALLPSKIQERLDQDDTSANARWRKVSARKLLADFTREELAQLGTDVEIVPRAHEEKAFARSLPVTRDLMWFLGWYVAEGTLSAHQVSLNIGEKDAPFTDELKSAIQRTFGEEPRLYYDSMSKGIKLYFHSVLAARLLRAWGLAKRALEKSIPSIVFSAAPEMQSAFLEGYFLGDGTMSEKHISFTTISPQLKDSLLYLLGQFGLLASVTEREPSANEYITSRHRVYTVTVGRKDQLAECRPIWVRHALAPNLERYLASNHTVPSPIVQISDDLIGLEVISAEEVTPVGEYVYDFSVQDDENFICGVGGICAHNTDADVDGAHIRTLLLTFFFRYMQPIIQNGHLYIAQPPIFRLEYKKNARYFYPEPGMKEDALLTRALSTYPEPTKVQVSRYKGLGEMNPEQLWETTLDPSRRTLLQVTIDDAVEADHIFDMLMGNEVPPRRKFITTHARDAKLDV